MKNLQDILQGIEIEKIIGPDNVKISAVDFDSRQVAPNSLFVAVNGTQVDGHIFVEKAIEMGAIVIICDV